MRLLYPSLLGLWAISAIVTPYSALAQALDHPSWFKFGGGDARQSVPEGKVGPRYPNFQQRAQFFVDTNSLPEILSANLSAACALGNFNQKQNLGIYVKLEMPDGSVERFGYANSDGVNLRDPQGRTADNQTYLFDDDGTSECKVYAVSTLF